MQPELDLNGVESIPGNEHFRLARHLANPVNPAEHEPAWANSPLIQGFIGQWRPDRGLDSALQGAMTRLESQRMAGPMKALGPSQRVLELSSLMYDPPLLISYPSGPGGVHAP